MIERITDSYYINKYT